MKTKIKGFGNYYYVRISDELLKELDWKKGDEMLAETTLDCYPNGEVTSIVLANITKHRDVVEEDEIQVSSKLKVSPPPPPKDRILREGQQPVPPTMPPRRKISSWGP